MARGPWASTTETPTTGAAPSTSGLGRRLVHRLLRFAVFPGDTRATVVRRVATFVIGWGAALAVLLWSGYHQGWLHGLDGLVWGAALTVVALLFSRTWVRPPGPGGQRPPTF